MSEEQCGGEQASLLSKHTEKEKKKRNSSRKQGPLRENKQYFLDFKWKRRAAIAVGYTPKTGPFRRPPSRMTC